MDAVLHMEPGRRRRSRRTAVRALRLALVVVECAALALGGFVASRAVRAFAAPHALAGEGKR